MQSVSEHDSEIRQKDYAKTGRNPEQGRCFKAPFSDQKACLDAAANANRNDQRANRDLVAQEVTAIWTKITAYAAIGGIVASIMGLVLVFIAYWEARKTNAIARAVGDAQTRAWVSVSLSVGQQINSSEGPFEIAMEMACHCANHGPSPALHLKFLLMWLT